MVETGLPLLRRSRGAAVMVGMQKQGGPAGVLAAVARPRWRPSRAVDSRRLDRRLRQRTPERPRESPSTHREEVLHDARKRSVRRATSRKVERSSSIYQPDTRSRSAAGSGPVPVRMRSRRHSPTSSRSSWTTAVLLDRFVLRLLSRSARRRP